MNTISRTITGIVIILLGAWFIGFIGIIDGPGVDIFGILFGGAFIILGLYILFNKKEDKIEKIKKMKGGKK